MKNIRLTSPFTVLVAVIALLALSGRAEFRLIDLGTLGGDYSSAWAINDRGEIVGSSTGPDGVLHGFWCRNGSMHSLSAGPSEADAINDAGQIAGGSLNPITNVIIVLPIFPPTNILFPPFTNPIVILPTNPAAGPIYPILPIIAATNPIADPIVISPPNPGLILPNYIPAPLSAGSLIPPGGRGVDEASVTASRGIGISDDPGTNGITITNISYIPQPAQFRNGSVIRLFTGTQSGVAKGINNRGEVVGSVSGGTVPTRAFIYRKGFTTMLGTLGGPFSGAAGINNRGDVAGYSTITTQSPGVYPIEYHPFLYHQRLMRDLGTLGGTYGVAVAINDVGEIVGCSSTVSNAEVHAFFYRNGRMTDLGLLGTGAGPFPGIGPQNYSCALAVNNWGQIVGWSTSTNGDHAFLYSNGTMIDLNDMVPLTDIDGAAGFVTLTYARGINDGGQIVGDGLYWDGSKLSTRAFLLEQRRGRR